jgi:hypothetical protein
MRGIIFTVLMLAAGIASAADGEEAGAKVHEYFDLFNKKDVETIAHRIYSSPVHVGGGDGHRVYANPAEAIDSLNSFYTVLADQDWRESVISDLQVCQLSPTLALVDTQFSRITSSGDPIPPETRTTLYVLQMIDGDWRIVSFYGHDPANRPACGGD